MASYRSRRPGSTLSLGRLAGIPIRLDVSWFLVAAVLTLLVAPVVETRVPGIGASAYLVGLAFAVLLYASVFLHELAHAVTGKRLGLTVNSITITLLGGLTEFSDDDPTPGRDALVAVAGPVASVLIGAAAWFAAAPLETGLTRFLVMELAVASLIVAAFNMLPTLPLDGGHLLKDAIWAVTGRPGPGYVVAGRAGYLLAVALVAAPWVTSWPSAPQLFSVLWSAALAWFVVGGARQAVAYGRLSDRLPHVSADALVRPVVTVPVHASLAEALAALSGAPAVGIVVSGADGRPLGLVDPAAAGAVPPDRLEHVAAATVARSLPESSLVPAGMTGLPLLRRLQAAPGAAHVVVDRDGRVRGLLLASDVDSALTRTG